MENTNDRRVSVWRVLFTLALAAWIVFIFSNSMKTGTVSSGVSGRVLGQVKTALRGMGLDWVADHITEYFLRKMGHFSEFMLEGFLLTLCVRVYTRRYLRYLSWPLLGGVLTGLADETLQLFVPDRSSQVTDVWIDFSGVAAGLLFAVILIWLCTRHSKHRNEDLTE